MADRRSAIPSVGGEEAEKEGKEREPGHECLGNEETEEVKFVGWVERRARNPSNPVPAVGPRWVSLSLNPSYGETRERRARTRAQQRAAGTKKTALFDIVKMEMTRATQRPRRARSYRVGGNALGLGRGRASPRLGTSSDRRAAAGPRETGGGGVPMTKRLD